MLHGLSHTISGKVLFCYIAIWRKKKSLCLFWPMLKGQRRQRKWTKKISAKSHKAAEAEPINRQNRILMAYLKRVLHLGMSKLLVMGKPRYGFMGLTEKGASFSSELVKVCESWCWPNERPPLHLEGFLLKHSTPNPQPLKVNNYESIMVPVAWLAWKMLSSHLVQIYKLEWRMKLCPVFILCLGILPLPGNQKFYLPLIWLVVKVYNGQKTLKMYFLFLSLMLNYLLVFINMKLFTGLLESFI